MVAEDLVKIFVLLYSKQEIIVEQVTVYLVNVMEVGFASPFKTIEKIP
jgi:hypothetical protein